MKVIKIKQEKQENGLWGTPFGCYYIESVPMNDRKMIIFSAIIAAFDEHYKKPFKIIFSDENGFKIRTNDTNNSFSEIYKLIYQNYEVIDDTLYEFQNEQEHITFLRQHKIKKLQNVDIGD